ncbi:MAG: MarR family winged helix-turn-helix transcriptional regulator [Pseudomonadota bacterium]
MAKQQPLACPDIEIEKSPMHLLHRVGQCATDVFQAEMAGADLTARQFAVLVSISRREGASQTDLVEMTGIDRSTLADIVRRMLKKGLIQRRRTKEDARAYAVKLTEEGRRALSFAGPLVERVDERILEAIPSQERKGFLDALVNIVSILGGLDEAGKTVTKPGSAAAKRAPKSRTAKKRSPKK